MQRLLGHRPLAYNVCIFSLNILKFAQYLLSLLCGHTFCAECIDTFFRARMVSILEDVYTYPPLQVPQTDDEGIALWKYLSGDATPAAFEHPCPTCRIIVDRRPVVNFFVVELVRYFRDTIQPLFGSPSSVVDLGNPLLFEGLFPHDDIDYT